MKDYLKNLISSLKFAFKSSPKYFFIKIIINILYSFIAIAYAYIFSNIISIVELKSNDSNSILLSTILLISLFIVQKIIPSIQLYIETRYYDQTCLYLEKVMISKMKNIEQSCYEESSFRDRVRLIRGKFGSIFNVGLVTINLITSIISIAYICLIMIKFNIIIIALLVLITVVTCLMTRYKVIKNEFFDKLIQEPSRKVAYFNGIFEDKITNSEMRMFNNGSFFINKLQLENNKTYNYNKKIENISNIDDFILATLNIIVYIVTIFISIKLYNSGNISIALISYYIGIINSFQNYNKDFSIYLNSFIYENTNIKIVNEFLNDTSIYENNDGIILVNNNPKIEFSNVWFKYPKSNEYVLKDCSFIVEPNQKVFLIGKNGSGKSTIFKLLFGFYRPNKGKILIDGIEIEKYNINTIRKIMGVLFQDYIKYSLPFREIISLSNFTNVNNNEELKSACVKSGIQKLVDTWPNHYDTILGTYYGENGIFMSGGQWQLTSLARTYFSHSNFFVLDEPSAALDIFSEDKIFREFYNDKVSNVLTISHMIANSVEADKIIVLDNGKIVEFGNHKELLKNNYLYRKWFDLQLSRYKNS